MSRKHGTSITKRSRLLCAVGCGLQRVTWIDPASYQPDPLKHTHVRLECGHERGELLPSRGLSLEHLHTAAGIALFPPAMDAPTLRTPQR